MTAATPAAANLMQDLLYLKSNEELQHEPFTWFGSVKEVKFVGNESRRDSARAAAVDSLGAAPWEKAADGSQAWTGDAERAATEPSRIYIPWARFGS